MLDEEHSLLQPDQSMLEILQAYGNLSYLLYHQTSYLASIMLQLNTNDLDVVLSYMCSTLFSNPYVEHEELNLLSLITVRTFCPFFSRLSILSSKF
jgi:hypothetical protein